MSAPFGAVFDMDGVIVDNRKYHVLAWKAFARTHGVPFDIRHFKDHLFGRVNREIFMGLYGHTLPESEVIAWAEEKESLYRSLYKGHVEPARGLVTFLRALSARGIPAAVATAAPRMNLDFALDEAGLRPYFQALVDVGQVRRGKPAPDLYLMAAEAIGVPASRCVAFEDSYPGLESALAAGMKVVGVTTTHTRRELGRAHLTARDFQGLTFESVGSLLGV
jgi:HAD superfamily hydrolase (TIGR01509 family)